MNKNTTHANRLQGGLGQEGDSETERLGDYVIYRHVLVILPCSSAPPLPNPKPHPPITLIFPPTPCAKCQRLYTRLGLYIKTKEIKILKKFVYTMPLVLLLALAACGPAPAPDPAVLTATAEAAVPVATIAPPPAPEGSQPEAPVAAGPINDATEITFTLTEAGDGDTPQEGDWVVIQLIGKLEDGTELFNTYTANNPIVYPYGDELMLQGVNDAVSQMRVGDKATAVIPPALGLGAEGGGVIPPNATLVFEMELVSLPRVEVTVLEEGSGEPPQPGNTLVVNYVGTLEDGTEFDSSYSRNQPFEFMLGVGQVIPGWEIGMGQMLPGSKARLVIPPELGYGSQEIPGIPANSTLIFEVELLEVK